MKIKIFCLLTALFLLTFTLTACGNSKSQQRTYDDANSTVAQSDESTTVSPVEQSIDDLLRTYQDTEESGEEKELLSRTVSISQEGLAAMEHAVSAIDVAYPYSDLSNVEAAYRRYQAMPDYQGEVANGLVTNLPLAAEILYEIIKKNNAAYMEEDSTFKRFQLDDEYILGACQVICDTVNQEIPLLGSAAMLADVDANLADLKISKSPAAGMANAMVTDDNCMYLNPVMIQNMEVIFDEELAEAKTIAHETEHIIQKRSTEARSALGIERGYGFCVSWEDQTVNSLYLNWFVEASAEKMATSLLGIKPMTYTAMIGYLDTLTFLNVLRGTEAEDTPRLTQQSSLNRVFELFDRETEEEQIELLEMLYSIEIFQMQPEDFMALYEERLGHEASDKEFTQLIIELKNAICQTMSKYFYRSLSLLLAQKQMTLQEVFYLISVFESDLNLHISYYDEERFDTIESFMDSYIILQQAFFSHLSDEWNISIDKLNDQFVSFHCRLEKPKDSVLHGAAKWQSLSISALSQGNNDFFNTYSRSVLTEKTIPLAIMKELMTK